MSRLKRGMWIKERYLLIQLVLLKAIINSLGKTIAADELSDLVKKEIIKTIGKGRATKYVLDN